MKKYLVVAVLSFILGCFATSPRIAVDIINRADSVRDNIELQLSKIKSEIASVSLSYKTELSQNRTAKESNIGDTPVMLAGFGCKPTKPKEPEKPKPPEVKPEPKPVELTPAVSKPKIISVRGEQNLVSGRMMFTKMKVELNKEGLDKVKKGAKVRIFIDYCYYESDKIESDGTVGFNIDWHPPLAPVKGKIGVSLFMQTNNPEIGSGIQYTSMVVNF